MNLDRFSTWTAIFMLAGCASAPTQPVLTTGAVSLPPIRDPVLVPCVKRSELPILPATYMRRTQSPDKVEIAAAADLAETTAYIVRADSLLNGCVNKFEAEGLK
ncbi:MAG: hypothetical protein ABI831_06810 [Betaproteobacteria bacterium]